jgi:hypothetical protein
VYRRKVQVSFVLRKSCIAGTALNQNCQSRVSVSAAFYMTFCDPKQHVIVIDVLWLSFVQIKSMLTLNLRDGDGKRDKHITLGTLSSHPNHQNHGLMGLDDWHLGSSPRGSGQGAAWRGTEADPTHTAECRRGHDEIRQVHERTGEWKPACHLD